MKIRPARLSDRDAMWQICHAVMAAGDALPFSDGLDREQIARGYAGPGTCT
jgi:hypothetical protein